MRRLKKITIIFNIVQLSYCNQCKNEGKKAKERKSLSSIMMQQRTNSSTFFMLLSTLTVSLVFVSPSPVIFALRTLPSASTTVTYNSNRRFLMGVPRGGNNDDNDDSNETKQRNDSDDEQEVVVEEEEEERHCRCQSLPVIASRNNGAAKNTHE